MNEKGGMTSVNYGDGSEFLTILESEEIDDIPYGSKIVIRENTKYLNLENAWELEYDATEWLWKKDRNFSYITEFGLLPEHGLKCQMEKFIENGGEHLYIYTTGRGIEQMYNYSKIALEVGIKSFVFNFHLGTNDKINEFIEWLKSHSKVEIL